MAPDPRRWTLDRRIPAFAVLALALVPALAQGPPPVSPELCRAVAKAWSLSATEAEAIAPTPGLTLEALSTAAMVAKRSGRPLAEVWALKSQRGSWTEAAREVGLDPDKAVSTLWAQLAPATREIADGLGEPFVVVGLVRTLERLTGRSPEPLTRDLGRRPFERALAEAAGLPPPGPGSPARGPSERETSVAKPTEGYATDLQGVKAIQPSNTGK